MPMPMFALADIDVPHLLVDQLLVIAFLPEGLELASRTYVPGHIAQVAAVGGLILSCAIAAAGKTCGAANTSRKCFMALPGIGPS